MADDFNVVISLDEKRDKVAHLDPSSNMLRDNINILNLTDVKPGNGTFTWNNKRSETEAISKRLDRFLVSSYWMDVRWSTSSDIIDWRSSDH